MHVVIVYREMPLCSRYNISNKKAADILVLFAAFK